MKVSAWPRGGRPLGVVAIVLAGAGLTACGLLPGGDDGCTGETVRLRMAASQDKVGLLQQAADDFGKSHQVDGKCVSIKVDSKNSGTAMLALARGWNDKTDGMRPDIWSPASNVWVTLLRQRAQAADKPAPVGDGEFRPIMTSPLTIAMPKPMAQALGWPGKAIGWSDLAKLSTDPKGWAAYGHPEWGPFRLGKTNPNLSTSGLNATVGAYFAATGTTGDLTTGNIADPKNRRFISDIEKSIVHYGDTSLTFLSNLQRADDKGQAMSYISAVTVEEDSIWNYNQGNPGLDPKDLGKHAPPKVPLVAIYPKDGTISSDHPFVPLTWMDAVKRKAADAFMDYLLEEKSQKLFMEHGYRDHEGKPGPRVTTANGLNPEEPKQKLTLPPGPVLNEILGAWGELRKPAKVLLVMDRSGSMTAEVPGSGGKNRGDLAKEAAVEGLTEFRGHDKVGLWMFSAKLRGDQDWQELAPVATMTDQQRQILRNRLQGITLEGGTGLYNTTDAAFKLMSGAKEAGYINAVVVLTDGKNERQGGIDLETLIGRLAAPSEETVRVFTIGYGAEADQKVLTQIAQAGQGAAYDSADPNTIKEVFTEVISNF